VNAAVGGTTQVTSTAGGAVDERTAPADGRRQVGTAPTGATAGTSVDAPEDGEPTPAGVDVESGAGARADAGPTDAAPAEGNIPAGAEGATDGADDDSDDDDEADADDEAADDDDSDADDETDADVAVESNSSTEGAVEGAATGSEEGGPSVDATARNVGRFASDGSGDPAWYDVTMDVPRTGRTDLDDVTGDAAGSATGPTADERLSSDEVRNAYVDPVSAFGNADSDDDEPTVGLDELGSRFRPTPSDGEVDEDASDGAGTEPDAARDDDGETVVDEPDSEPDSVDADAEPGDAGDDEDDATADAPVDPGTEVVDVETLPADDGATSGVDVGEDDPDESDLDDTDDDSEEDPGTDADPVDADVELDEADEDADAEDAETGDGDATAPSGEDADAVVSELAATKERIRERHQNESGSLDYTSLQQEAAATPGVKGSGMPAEEMLDALAAAAVHDDATSGDEEEADVDAVADALAARREETDDDPDADGDTDDVASGPDGEADDAALDAAGEATGAAAGDADEATDDAEDATGDANDAAGDTEHAAGDADDGGIADLVNRELDTLTQEVGGTSMTPDVSGSELDAAVDELDGGSYTFPLSGSSFDVSADANAETATLTFTSTEGMELDGARERLLTYQLRNYLDRDDTTHAELSVNENAVVLEIPAADGPAVNAWADAIVQIIDRTLYLSKDDD
jgi:hypothetical protein